MFFKIYRNTNVLHLSFAFIIIIQITTLSAEKAQQRNQGCLRDKWRELTDEEEIEYMDDLVGKDIYLWDGVNGLYKFKAN